MPATRIKGYFPDEERWPALEVYRVSSSSSPVNFVVSNYGASLLDLSLQMDSDGWVPVLFKFDRFEDYLRVPYVGSTMGRFCRSVSRPEVVLGEQVVHLTRNDDPGHLHGGISGFDKKFWSAEAVSGEGIRFSYFSPHGEEGYPGNLHASVTYTLRGNDLEVEYAFEADRPTLANLCNHAYWRLSGADASIASDLLRISSGSVLEVAEGRPTGRLVRAGEKLDFTKSRRISDSRIDCYFPMENVCVELFSPVTGIGMTVTSDQSGCAIYTGDHLCASKRAVCIQPSAYPDSPLHPHFPQNVVGAREARSSRTVFSFSGQTGRPG